MRQILIFIVLSLLGVAAGALSGVDPIRQEFFPAFAAFALTLGLYGSVSGIDLLAIRRRIKLAIVIVTLAVPLKILVSGLLLYLIHPLAVSFLLCVAMAQIDPLSVDSLLQDKHTMSKEAKGLLRIWAAFDDPMTVLFGFLVLLPLVTGISVQGSVASYLLGVALNVIPAVVLWLIAIKTRLLCNRTVAIPVLIAVLLFAFVTRSSLLAALTGLMLRPIPEKVLQRVVSVFYFAIVFVVGMATYNYGVDLRLGLLLAIIQFFVVQPATAIFVFRGTAGDLLRIAFAQQNGLTTLLMGIAFQSLGFPVLHVLLPGIVFVNLLNLAVNKVYHWKEERGLVYPDTLPTVSEPDAPASAKD